MSKKGSEGDVLAIIFYFGNEWSFFVNTFSQLLLGEIKAFPSSSYFIADTEGLKRSRSGVPISP